MTMTNKPLGWTRKGRPIWPVAGGSGEDEPKTFTQEELDRVVGERLARERANAPKVPDDYNELKAKAARLEKLEAANQSELEKAQTKATEAEGRAQQAEARAAAADRRRAVIEAASGTIKVGEVETKFVDPSVAPMFIGDDVDASDPAAVTAALTKILTDRPYLAAGKAGVPDFEAGPRGKTANKQPGDAGQAEADKRFGTSEVK